MTISTTDPDQARRLALQADLRKRATQPIHDQMQCINCRTHARHGVIVHKPTCPEYGRTTGRAHIDSGASKTRDPYRVSQETPRDAWRRYQRFVGMLTPGRPDRYVCPSCGGRGDGRGLKVDFDPATKRIIIHCFTCRGFDEILRAMRCDKSWLDGIE